MAKVTFTIDGKPVTASPGSMIIQAADEAGVYIPRFCYHKKLTVAANCRMCLVEVEKAPKALPACATPVGEGMAVLTRSKAALDAQKAVMEFLLINHPLDCPICDQGGQCELQDLAMGYGQDTTRYEEGKRSVADKDIGPLIATEMTRCIHCTRCVRFGEEVAGLRELGATGRGESTEIGTYIAASVQSHISGNVIDLCPVGALTAKPSRFHGRAWEYRQHESVAAHDCIGSNVFAHTRLQNDTAYRQLMRVVPKENEAINETWISDRDRYSYEAVNSEHRLTSPMIKVEGKWRQVDWETAMSYARDRLNTIKEQFGADQVAGIVHPSASLEEQFLMQKMLRGFGSPHIDHRIHQSDFSDQDAAPLYPLLGTSLAEMSKLDAALLIGSNMDQAQPIACQRLRQAAKKGAKILAVNPAKFDYHMPLTGEQVVAINQLPAVIAGLAKAAASAFKGALPESAKSLPTDVKPDADAKAFVKTLVSGAQRAIYLGESVTSHPDASLIIGYAEILAQLTGCRLGVLSQGANAAGAWIAGAVPHRGPSGTKVEQAGDDAKNLFESGRRGYVLCQVEPHLDCFNPGIAISALKNAQGVIAMTSFMSETLAEVADVLLPLAGFGESAGTLVNAEGRWQSFQGVTEPLGAARPGWKVLRVLANFLGLDGFSHTSAQDVHAECLAAYDEHHQQFQPTARMFSSHLPAPETGLMRFGGWPAMAVDSHVRHAPALQAAHGEQAVARMHSKTAEAHQLLAARRVIIHQAGVEMAVAWVADDTLPEGQLYLATGLLETAYLGDAIGSIEIVGSEPHHG